MRKKDDKKQQNIKQAVIKLILEEGFHGVSMSKIAKEARVSPATMYIYYDNKQAMLHDIYQEYKHDVYTYVCNRIRKDMDGKQFIETVVRSYYSYIIKYGEEFYFVEQFSSCPALIDNCEEKEASPEILSWLNEYKKRRVIKDVDNVSIKAILFNPVKTVAVQHRHSGKENSPMLDDLIKMIQDALLR